MSYTDNIKTCKICGERTDDWYWAEIDHNMEEICEDCLFESNEQESLIYRGYDDDSSFH